MNRAQKDSKRAITAAKVVIDDRDPVKDRGAIMVTLEHMVAAVLLTVMDNDPKKAAAMMNEGLVEGVEWRLGLYQKKTKKT